MQAIKKEDVRKLQETYSRFFGAKPEEIKKNSSKHKEKSLLFWLCTDYYFRSATLFH